jgi:hypothetical protein
VTTRPARLSLVITTVLAGSACSPTAEAPDKKSDTEKPDTKAEPIKKTVEHTNTGTACISAGVDQAQAVQVDFGLCMSSSCDTLDSASCTVEQAGTELKVSSKATVTSDAGPDTVCTTDCRMVAASCTGATIAAGTYTLVYGDMRQEVTVPVADKACTKDPRFE